jgi:DNA processing protein
MSTAFWIALNNIEGIGLKTIKHIYQHIPNLSEENLISNEQELRVLIKNSNILRKIFDENFFYSKLMDANKLISKHKEKGIEVIDLGSEYYPKLLRLIDDPPAILYCRGNLKLLKGYNSIAIVGTRKPTELGYKAAMKIAAQFVKRNYIIVSGLAIGIDTAGHLGALKANGSTIAVLAGSLDKIYPKENKDVAEEIVNKKGLLISETPLGGQTFRNSFVKRDRIQSGLSLGVCPIQTPIKGGTQHTIKFAQDQGRLLFCPEPLENRNIEATQGIYHLLDNGIASRISRESDYQEIISKLEEICGKLLDKESNINIDLKRPKLNKLNADILRCPKQMSLFDESDEETDSERMLNSHFDSLITQLVQVSERLSLDPEEVIKRIKNAMDRTVL